ncbi:MAG: hypothetical protein WKF60_05140 [Ilumatobacter sp.]
MRDHLDQFGDALPVVVTLTDDPRRLAAYREHLDIEFPVLADVDSVLYDLLGAGRWLDPHGVVTGNARDIRTPVAAGAGTSPTHPPSPPKTLTNSAPTPSSDAMADSVAYCSRPDPMRGRASKPSSARRTSSSG